MIVNKNINGSFQHLLKNVSLRDIQTLQIKKFSLNLNNKKKKSIVIQFL